MPVFHDLFFREFGDFCNPLNREAIFKHAPYGGKNPLFDDFLSALLNVFLAFFLHFHCISHASSPLFHDVVNYRRAYAYWQCE